MLFHKKNWTLFVTAALLTVSLVGCGTADIVKKPANNHQSKTHSSGDIRETTKANQLPSFVEKLDPSVVEIYKIAGQNASLLESIPCYCGCGQSAGHKSNRDCFIYDLKKDGTIVWDSHGTTCGTCLDIAAESVALKNQGKSTLEIRKYIDSKYKDGYAQPTPTPMPS